MQVSKEGRHLFVGKAASEGGHHSLAREHIPSHRFVGGRSAAGQRLPRKNAAQVRRNLLEGQVVILVAMGATDLIEAFPFRFLRSKRRRRVTGRDANVQTGRDAGASDHPAP